LFCSIRKAASTSQSQHLGFKDRLARGADFGHFPIAIGLLLGKVFFFGEPELPLVVLLFIGLFPSTLILIAVHL
jgi:hypothetical protein